MLDTHTPELWELPTRDVRVKEKHQGFRENRKRKAEAQWA